MRYGSVCSGIEAATMAWHSLGWTPAFFSEIEPFPSAVLAHHYGSNMPGEPLAKNGIPNYGDFTKIAADAGPVDLLVGGTPCQSFSVAGKRLGLDDPRGNLALEYLALARRLNAKWIVWENVPGVLSSHSGDEQTEEVEGAEGLESADFATFLSFVQECGYGYAYRVLDAQYVRVDEHARATPQRRRRVFVVGYFGDWRRAAAVLLEPQGMRGDPAPRRQAGKGVAPTISSRPTGGGGLGTDFDLDGGLIASTGEVSHCLNAGGMGRIDFETETFVAEIAATLPAGGNATGGERQPGMGAETAATMLIAHAIQAGALRENPDAGPDGVGVQADVAYTLEARSEVQAAQLGWAVRRLMPVECERLQRFPDNFTNVPWRGKPTAPDGPRYKALGNSMAVNVMRWIGQRIDLMEELIKSGRIA
ncbi:UNVERIFIED_ORG: DNA (cytosine-5)-methyltransferase 1 [Rhizobium sophorae]|uniref:DNA cytosine methyltransferase n=1 Tax=Rhizobium leguminosarum TaxID=384 RepID=UPI00160E0A53|nr:DNA cytosine methyltransferase [Rhizobium leguminosarum]MBB4520503.1 DNA (cytosine-5)-methyltransferase 1 [Rhizobium leguminosarum]MDH6658384.1 DNA (cytosine-5)-methyltransferase 1 [Rhizobium sophorae]